MASRILPGEIKNNQHSSSVTIEGLDETLAAFKGLQRDLKKEANKELRAASKMIGQKHVIPVLPGWAAAAPTARLAVRIAATARVRSDRKIAVRIGGVNPKISGFTGKRSMKRKTANRAAVAWGSESGPKGGWRPPESTKSENFYGAPLSKKGYWVEPGLPKVSKLAIREYQAALAAIMRKYKLI